MDLYTKYVAWIVPFWYVVTMYGLYVALRVGVVHLPFPSRAAVVAVPVYGVLRSVGGTLRAIADADHADDVNAIIAVASIPLAFAVSFSFHSDDRRRRMVAGRVPHSHAREGSK